MPRDLKYGAKAIRKILNELEAPKELAHLYAEAVLAQAVRNASSRPTPQAPMVARSMRVVENEITLPAGGTPWEVAQGSEFGSSIYRQFHASHNERGYWFFPASESVLTLAQADKALEDILQSVIDGT